MALTGTDVRSAIEVVAADPQNEFGVDDLLEAAERFRPVLIALWSAIPWWQKVIITLRALLGALDDYLGEQG